MMKRRRPALSFIEVILYVAIVSMMAVVFIMFGVKMIELRSDTEENREVVENGHYVMDVITYQVRDAQSISLGTYGAHPGALTLTADTGSITIDTATKTLYGQTVRYLQINDGSGAVPMTSDQVDVTNFVLTNLQRNTEPANVQVLLTLTSLDGTYSESFQTSISLRE